MPPKSRSSGGGRKKVVKKTTTPVRRPSTRRTPNPTAPEDDETLESPVVPETNENESPLVETPVKNVGEKVSNTSCLETPVSTSEKVEENEKGVVFLETPVSIDERAGDDVLQTPVGYDENEKDDAFGETATPVVETLVSADEKVKDATSIETPLSVAKEIEDIAVETPVINDEKEKDAVFSETPVSIGDKSEIPSLEIPVMDNEKEKDFMCTENPLSADEKAEHAMVAQEAVEPKVDPEAEGSKKKVVKKVKKVTRKVVVKKVAKVVKKGELRREEEAVTGEGLRAEEEKEHSATIALNPDSVSNENMEGMEVEMVGKVLTVEEEKEPNASAVLNPDSVSNATTEENHDIDVKTDDQEDIKTSVVDSVATDASCAEALDKQETTMDVDELPTAKDGDVQEKVEEEKDKKEEASSSGAAIEDEDAAITERQQRRKTEIFVGGLDREAKEEDIRKVFGKIGEIVEIRLMMDNQTGKNKGYAFVRYAMPAHAKQAVSEFAKVEVCGKVCGAAALEGNDTIFLGNIDKRWKKDDLLELLHGIGIEKIDTLTVMSDPNNADFNRGFAFLELETNRDAQVAFKKLQKKDAFGKGLNVKVAWAAPHNEPDEEDMQKVKSVYAESVPLTWSEEKVKECFIKFGDIERVVLSRNMQYAKRKDYAFINYTTRESALSCIDLFDKEEIFENGTKVNIRVSLAKPVQKSKQNKGASRYVNNDMPKERRKAVQGEMKGNATTSKAQPYRVGYASADRKTSAVPEFLQQQPSWKQGQLGYARGTAVHNYPYIRPGEKRPYSSLGDPTLYSDPRGYPRARTDGSFPAANPSMMPTNLAGTTLPYYQQPTVGRGAGAYYGAADPSSTLQPRYGNFPPYGSSRPSRY